MLANLREKSLIEKQINKSNRFADVGSFLAKIGKVDKQRAEQLRVFSEEEIKKKMTREGIHQHFSEEAQERVEQENAKEAAKNKSKVKLTASFRAQDLSLRASMPMAIGKAMASLDTPSGSKRETPHARGLSTMSTRAGETLRMLGTGRQSPISEYSSRHNRAGS